MYISDRASALIMAIMGFLIPLSFIGLQFLIVGEVRFLPSRIFYLLLIVISCAICWIMSAFLYSRNRPARGANEDDVRRNVRNWYRDAKKWMDEHPEHVDMKDL